MQLRTLYIFMLLSGFIWCMLSSLTITVSLPIFYKSPIPSFFDICNYQGYADAIKSGNYTEYYSLTTFGKFGDISKCRNFQQNSSFLVSSAGGSMMLFSLATYTNLMMLMFRRKSVRIYCSCLLFSCISYVALIYISCVQINNNMISANSAYIYAIVGCFIGYVAYYVNVTGLKKYFPKTIFKDVSQNNNNNLERLIDT